MKKILSTLLLASTTLFGFSQSTTQKPKSVQEAVALLEAALKAKKFELLKDHLDEKFMFNTMEQPTSAMVMQQVVTGYPLTLTKITINQITEKEEKFIVNVNIVSTKENEVHNLEVSKDFQIIRADIVKIQMGH